MSEAVAEAAIQSLGRHGLPVVRSDIPGLYAAPGYPELTFGQLLQIASHRDPTFDPARPGQPFQVGLKSL